MSLSDWISNTGSRVRNEGVNGLSDSAYSVYSGSWRITCSRLPLGTNIFERGWDMLVVLDGCRTDLFQEVIDEYDNLGPVETALSVGSSSREWLAKTFVPRYREDITNTAYVSANPYTEEIIFGRSESTRSPFNPANWETVEPDAFLAVEDVTTAWEDDLGTVPPRAVTNTAIRAGREYEPDRLVVHYMQPHQPFLSRNETGSTWRDASCWDAIRTGDANREAVWEAYRENLRVVLDDIKTLCENVDASRTVLTADHGNAVGEWFIYGHPNGFPHPSVKRVPWVETIASDDGTLEPSQDEQHETTSSVEERLEHLGYR